MKKLVSVLLAAAVALSSALMMTGCEEQEYPVSIANYTIEKEPENVVVLDPITADIMAYMDFERSDFSEGSTGALGSLAAQGSENKEYWIDSFFVLISGNIRRNRRKRLWPEEADSAAAWVCPAT